MENTNSAEDNKSTIFGTDRSWNDPQALFEYQNTNAAPGGASKLNKRVFFPGTTGIPEGSEKSSVKPENSNLNDAGAKSTDGISVPPPPLAKGIPKSESEKTESKEEVSVEKETFTLEDVSNSLDQSIVNAETSEKIDSKKAGDIRKRIKMFEDKWNKDQLNEKLKSGMFNLSQHLIKNEVQEAEKLQQRLNLDHPSQCTPWMIAIRQLILALKTDQ